MTAYYPILLTVPLLLICKGAELKKTYLLILAFLAIAIANTSISHYIPKLFPHVLEGLRWNWLGKSAGFIFGLVVVSMFRLWRFEEFNLRFAQKKNSYGWLVAYGAYLTCIFFLHDTNMRTSVEDLLFQATLPGLHEELICRSLLLGITLRLVECPEFSRTRKEIYAIGVVSLYFGLGHVEFNSFTFSGQSILHEIIAPFAETAFFGFCMGVIAVRSGSIVFPIIFHGVFNISLYIGSPFYP
jgi:membrane protease YdiL (CAAX protease family)